MVDLKAWLNDKELWDNNPLKPDMAVQMLSKAYNVECATESAKWRMARQANLHGENIPKSRAEDLLEVKDGLMRVAVGLNLGSEETEKIWSGIKPFLENPQFVRFVLDAHCHESEFFFAWLACVPRSIVLELHFGLAPDLAGRFREIPRTDIIWYWVQADPGLNLVGYRHKKTQKLLADKPEVLDLASGWFQWLRHGNYSPQVEKQVIYSCDLDPSATPEYVLSPNVAGCTLSDESRSKLEHQHRVLDVRLMINQMIAEGRKFDAVNAGGIMSYMMEDYNWVVEHIMNNLLKPGGVFLHDLQLMHWCMLRDGAIFAWNQDESNIQLMKSTAEAEARIEYAFSGVPGVQYELDFDQSNEEPLAVLVTARRPE
ncbi:hypothetical protein IJG66_01430 [Candidatus Saccharibacteria bacterium]|nr:hypothetical protein [Candidatus Saccharibacteria bacterium]